MGDETEHGLTTAYQRCHWRVFNAGVRVFGLGALIVAASFAVSSIYVAVRPEVVRARDTVGLPPIPVYLTCATLLVLIAIPLLRAPAYRPDLGDSHWKLRRHRSGERQRDAARRTWWTGQPKKGW